MVIETSAIQMVIDEKSKWEYVLPNALIFLEKIIELEDRELGNQLELGFVNVLFSMKLLEESYEKLKEYLRAKFVQEINKFHIQRDIRYFFLNADNILDVIDKFCNKLDASLKFYKKEREDQTINKVNGIRNFIVHEGVPTLMFNEFVRDNSEIVHGDVAFHYPVNSDYINITMFVPEVGKFNLNGEVDNIFIEVRKLVSGAVNKIAGFYLSL